jgi:DNA modification methylase
MTTTHRIVMGNACNLSVIADATVHLVVTSPPYPMIEMWDEVFSSQSEDAKTALLNKNGSSAFQAMHNVLDLVWKELFRVLIPGGFACINIGDATRTIGPEFALYPNHARIISACSGIGFTALPSIVWRKQTNAPNKFMGSGMLPAGAYVTLEHEYILIFRKGGKRQFTTGEEKVLRSTSALFWEERNNWYSDVWWDLKGTGQELKDKSVRNRSGAFPFELAYRLISMYSVQSDIVVDPFLGTGTTTLAAITANRNSIGVEFEKDLLNVVTSRISQDSLSSSNAYIRERIGRHLDFIQTRETEKQKTPLKHRNKHYGFPVMTRQETEICLNYLQSVIRRDSTSFSAGYDDRPMIDYFGEGSLFDTLG